MARSLRSCLVPRWGASVQSPGSTPPQRLVWRESQPLVTIQSREVVGRGKGCCLWSFYCASVSLGSFGSLL